MKLFTLKSKIKPKWYDFRRKFANWLVKMAHKIDPGNPDAYLFLTQLVMEQALASGPTMLKFTDMLDESGPVDQKTYEALGKILRRKNG